jgi:hypothetical protein
VTVIDAGVVTAVAEGSTVVRIQATGGGVSTSSQTTVTVNAATPGMVKGVIRDAATSIVISGASVDLTGSGAPLNTTTDASGAYSFAGVAGGTYTASVTAGGFVNATAVDLMVVNSVGDVVRADFALTPNGSTQRFGGIGGRVYFGGAPLAGATVSISGGAQTNGTFQSATTDSDGTYSLVGLGLDDTSGTPIAEFTVLSSFGFSAAQATVSLIQNQTIPNVDLNLAPNEGLAVYFEDDFESNLTPWSTTGVWNRSMLVGVSNAAYPTYVDLAPSDPSNGALPLPVQGQYAFWYGDEATGNFLGTQSSGDAAGSGGTSETANQGSLTSPSFLIPAAATNATLRFVTWFEIESVNPNAQGFDIMNVSVLPAGASAPTNLARLNPFIDPTLSPRTTIPFTSGGFNLTPVWRTEFLDLSAYVGQSIQLVFEFDTVDSLYNGFRGWLIDEVSVTSGL